MVSRRLLLSSTLLYLAQRVGRVKAHNHKPQNNNNLRKNNDSYGNSFVELNPSYVPPSLSSSYRISKVYHNPQGNNDHNNFEEVYFSSSLPSQQREFRQRETRNHNARFNSHRDSKAIGLFSLARDYTALFPSLAVTTAACVSVFVAWQVPSCGAFLQNWCVASWYNLRQGRWPCLVLNAVSHAGFLHLAFNVVTLVGFGPAVQRVLQSASWPLWPLMLGATLSGSWAFLVWQQLSMTRLQFKRHQQQVSGGCMGLSTVTCALITVFGRMHPDTHLRLLLAGVLPVRLSGQQLWWVLLGTSVAALVLGRSSQVAHAAHLGGVLFGLLYYELWMRRYRLAGRLALWKQGFVGNRK